MEDNCQDAIAIYKHPLDDSCHQLLARLGRIFDMRTTLPVHTEMLQQVGSLDQVIVVYRTERFHLTLKLLALIQVLGLVDEWSPPSLME